MIIMQEEQVESIRGLCSAFDDKTEQEEVMFGLVHAVEYLGREKNVIEIAKSISIMLPHAKEWAILLHCRILNDEQVRGQYAEALLQLDEKLLEPPLKYCKK